MAAEELTVAELRMLVAVADACSVSGAAEALALTQSAVSHALRSAERKIGVSLFVRGRAGSTPTPAGERAVAHARTVLSSLASLADESRWAAHATPLTRPVSVATFRSAAAQLLPAVVTSFRQHHPGVRIDVRVVSEVGRAIAQMVADGKADVGITALPPPELPASQILLDETFVLVRPSRRGTPESLPLIVWSEICSRSLEEWLRGRGTPPTRIVTAEDDTVVLAMVEAGLGYAIMPHLSSLDGRAGVVTSCLRDAPRRRVGYLVAPSFAQTAAAPTLLGLLRRAARGLPAPPAYAPA